MIEGAQPSAEMPGFIPSQLATLKPKPPAGDRWIHEIKFDGYRAQVHLNGGRVRIFTRKGLDWTKRFSAIAEAFAGIPIERAIIDGEIVVVENERTDFGALQADLSAGKQNRLLYYAFDMLYLEGFDLRRSPQIERKRILKSLFDDGAGAVQPAPRDRRRRDVRGGQAHEPGRHRQQARRRAISLG